MGLGVAVGVVALVGAAVVLREPAPSASATDTAVPSTAPTPSAEASEMVAAAQAFLVSLEQEQRARTQFPFDSDERFDWHYIPRQRNGLRLADMTPAQREAAALLLRSALSETGYAKTTGVIELEGILGQLSGNTAFRDPDRYSITLFGTPAPEAPWGWRLEGHHLSLNFSSVTDSLTATTPLFLGANPATVPSGPRAGWRVLGDEEDQARALLNALTDGQRTQAVLATQAPPDIITGADPQVRLETFEGLAASAMTEAQYADLWRLIETYIGTVQEEWATARLRQLRATPPDSLFFAWAGGKNPGEGHYYRIHAPALLIEYDNTQGGANHIHAVWRDPGNDFGADWLRQHYEAHPHE
ncbi:MAG: DUF3500 domain-containing protein [Rhodothermaceae bacterium]|nr:DUF3500 domain-containing protein [Rhodothermaceae bacterium]